MVLLASPNQSSGLTRADPSHKDSLSLEELGVVAHFVGAVKVDVAVGRCPGSKPESRVYSVDLAPGFPRQDLNLWTMSEFL